MTIERAIANAESLVRRKLTGEELLILGVAYQDGYLAGFRYKQEKGVNSPENLKRKASEDAEKEGGI